MNRYLVLSAMLVAVALGPVVAGDTLPDTQPAARALRESRRLIDQPDERVSVLDNGLTVILKAHRTAPVVSVRMYCRTGSIYEQEYLGSGMSHLFEHLLHGAATTTRTEEQSRKILNEIGGYTNAYTSYDVTCYFINTARDNTATAVSLLADWITHPTFPQGAFEREWGVVQRELERDVDNPETQLFEITNETMYLRHPVRYPIIGYQPVVQSLKKADIVGYYHRMYVPDNILVCIVGDIDLEATLGAVQRQFASFTRQRMPTIVLPTEPEMTTPRQAIKRMKVEAAMMQLAWPSIHLTHPDLYALDLLSYVLTEGDSSRLARTIRDARLTYTIGSSSWTPEWARGIFVISARLDPDKVEQAKAAILEQIAIVQRDLISEEELHQAQRQKAAEHVFESQTAESVASMMASDFLSTGDPHFSKAYVDNIQKVTAEQVREMARKYLVPQRLGTILILPEEPSAGTAEASKRSGPEPVRMIKLDNGLRCLIRRDPTSPLVAMQCFSLGGVAYETEKTNGLSQLIALLAPRGTKARSAEQIARFFDARGGYLNGQAGNNTIYFQAQVLKDDAEPALEVFADVICHPVFPKQELETYRPAVLDRIKQIDEQWRSELAAYFRSRFFTRSPYRFDTTGSLDVVAAATPEEIARFYRQRVTGGQTVLAIFGDVDPAKMELLVRKYFADLPAGGQEAIQSTAEPPIEAPRLYIKAKGPDRRVAGIYVGFTGMEVSDTADVVPMTVLDTIISGYRLPTGWLEEALRGKDRSLVYEVHAINFPGLIPGFFGVYAACQPEKVSEVYRIITAQLDRARAGRFTPDELERAKTIITTTDLMEQQTNSERAQQAALDELYGLGYNYREKFTRDIRAVTLEDVTRMARKFFKVPVVAVVTPDPKQVDIGMKPSEVTSDKRAPKPPAGAANDEQR
jgi:zinc protease